MRDIFLWAAIAILACLVANDVVALKADVRHPEARCVVLEQHVDQLEQKEHR